MSKGEKNIHKIDWICLFGALIGIILWILTSDPLNAVIIVVVVDVIAFIPTFRKAYYKPFEETLLTFGLSGISFLTSIFALENYSPTTWLYPVTLVLTNFIFVAIILIRRKKGKELFL